MPVFNKENAIALLKGMLAAQTRPVIHFIRSEDVLGPKQFKHTYRFFIASDNQIFNVSGLITAIFAVVVHDRSQTFSINNLNAEEDLKQFSDAIMRVTGLPNLVLTDIVMGAEDVLDLVISPGMLGFFPDDNGAMAVSHSRFSIPPIIDPEQP
jgi:hypothetical protein